jgi:hypothetical protein
VSVKCVQLLGGTTFKGYSKAIVIIVIKVKR